MSTGPINNAPLAPAAPPSTIERLTAEREQFEARAAELTSELAGITRTLAALRTSRGEAIAAGADSAEGIARIRELEAQAEGIEEAIGVVTRRREALDKPILAERRRLANAEAETARGEYRVAVGQLAEAAADAVTHLRELREKVRGAGIAANNAAMQSDQLSGRPVTTQSAQQVWSGRVSPPALANLLDAGDQYVADTGNDRLFAQMREGQRRDAVRAREEFARDRRTKEALGAQGRV
jgi:hypothetical protein